MSHLSAYVARQRQLGRAPEPWTCNGFTLAEAMAGKHDRTRGVPEAIDTKEETAMTNLHEPTRRNEP